PYNFTRILFHTLTSYRILRSLILHCRWHLWFNFLRCNRISWSPRNHRIIFLHLHLPSYRSRLLLWLLLVQRNMKYRNHPPFNINSNSLCRLRSTMRPNILLRRYRHHQPILRYSLHRPNISRMSLRWFLR
uniref:Uncharacterized protein n=1 Tax=Nothoprocta perdicaria TaxID=30464 RepID=A0A8C6ZXF8_NOTPE